MDLCGGLVDFGTFVFHFTQRTRCWVHPVSNKIEGKQSLLKPGSNPLDLKSCVYHPLFVVSCLSALLSPCLCVFCSPQLSTTGYMPSSVYDTRTQYRSQMYPTLSSSSSRNTMSPTSSLSPASTRSLQDDLSSSSLASSSNNLYNVTLQQTSRYESTDMLKLPSSSTDIVADSVSQEQQKLQLPSKHGSLDRAYKRGDYSYGSLDRKKQRQRERQQGYSVEPRDREGGRERQGGTPPLHLDIKSTYLPGGFGDSGQPPSHTVELPVYHEQSHYPAEQGNWRETIMADPPSVRSPDTGRPSVARGYNSYSPRLTETAHQPRLAWDEGTQQRGMQQLPVHHQQYPSYQQQPPPVSPQQSGYPPYRYDAVPVPILHVESQAGGGHSPQPQSPTPPPPAQSTLVTVTRLKPHMEVTKPYETSDFFKYSERLRKQRIIENYQRQLMGGVVSRSGASTPSHSSDSDTHSLHSSHSGSSLTHPMRLAAASVAYYAATGSPGKSSSDLSGSRGVAGFPPHYHRQDSDHSVYSTRSEQGSAHEQNMHSGGREQAPFSGGGNAREVLSSASEFQTVHSQGPLVHVASAQSQSSYRAQYMQAVASAKHSHYQPPTPMTCRPVTNHAAFKPNQGKWHWQSGISSLLCCFSPFFFLHSCRRLIEN